MRLEHLVRLDTCDTTFLITVVTFMNAGLPAHYLTPYLRYLTVAKMYQPPDLRSQALLKFLKREKVPYILRSGLEFSFNPYPANVENMVSS